MLYYHDLTFLVLQLCVTFTSEAYHLLTLLYAMQRATVMDIE